LKKSENLFGYSKNYSYLCNVKQKNRKKMASRGKRLEKRVKRCAVVAFPTWKLPDGIQYYRIVKK